MAAVPVDVAARHDEAVPPRADSTGTPRVRLGIETISDVVFGLALEIGSISIVAKLPQTATDLTTEIVEFGFSFVVVFMAWFSYRRAVVALPYETPRTLIVNVALLFCVSIEPFLFYVLVTAPGNVGEAAPVAFALDIGATMLLLSLFTYLLLEEERKAPQRRVHPAILRQMRVGGIGRAVVAVAFFVSALPVFGLPGPLGQPIREDVWVIGLVLFIIVQRGGLVFSSRSSSVGT